MFYVLLFYVLSSRVLHAIVLIIQRLKNADAPSDGLELDDLYLAMGSPIILNERPPDSERDQFRFRFKEFFPNTKYYCSAFKYEIYKLHKIGNTRLS